MSEFTDISEHIIMKILEQKLVKIDHELIKLQYRVERLIIESSEEYIAEIKRESNKLQQRIEELEYQLKGIVDLFE